MVRKTHHFLQYIFAVFVVYLFVTRLLISWVQFAPDSFVSTAQWASNSQISVSTIEVQQDWLGFQFQLAGLDINHEHYQVVIDHIDADVNLFSLLVPSMHFGTYLEVDNGFFHSKVDALPTDDAQNVDVKGLDIEKLTQVNLDISRLWKRVYLKDLVLNQVIQPGLTVHVDHFQSLKGAQLSIASEFSLAYQKSLSFERFSLKSTFQPNVWGGLESGEFSLSSFEPLRVEALAKFLPEVWHGILPKGELILDLNAQVAQSKLSKLVLNLNSQSLKWPQKHKSLPKSLGLELLWEGQQQNIRKHFTNWTFRISKIQLDNRYIEAVSPLELRFAPNNQLHFSAPKFDIAPFKLLVQSLVPNRHIGALFDKTADLKIADFSGQFDWKKLTLPRVQLNIQKLAIPVTDYPGLAIEDLTIVKNSEIFSLRTNKPIWVMTDKVHKDAMRIDLPAGFTVTKSDKDKLWVLDQQKFTLDNIPLTLSATSDDVGVVDANLDFDIGTMYKLKQYLPYKLMHVNLQNWLESALIDGRNIKGNAVLKGDLANFPFTDGSGVFEVNARIEKTYLKFNPQWPRLENFTGQIKFTPFDLSIKSDRIYLGAKAHAKNVVVNIRDLDTKDIALDISGQITTHFDRALEYLKISPLAKALNIEAFINSSDFGGEVVVELDQIWVPLSGHKAEAEKVIGRAHFRNANMTLLKQVPVKNIVGTLEFNENGIHSSGLKVSIFDGQGVFAVKTNPKDQQISISGLGRFFEQKNLYFENPTPWTASISVPFKADKTQSVQTDINVDFFNTKSLLPEPLGHDALVGKKLHLLTSIESDEVSLQAKIPDLVSFGATWVKQNNQFQAKKLQLILGENIVKPENIEPTDSYVKGVVKQLELERWIGLSQSLEGDATLSEAPSLLHWKPSSLKIQAMHMWDKVYSDVSIEWLESNLRTDIRVQSPDVAAHVLIKPNAPIEMTVDRLLLQTAKERESDVEVAKVVNSELSSEAKVCRSHEKSETLWPEVIFKGQNIQIDDYIINNLDFRVTDNNEMLVISRMEGRFGNNAGVLTGQYLFDKALDESKLALSLKSNKVEAVTRFLQLKEGFSGEKARVDVTLEWAGRAECFSRVDSKGVIDFELKEGAIEDIEPGFARLIGLLSIESLARRLQLDMKDLTNKGLVYDRIKGRAVLNEGQLELESFKLTAPSATANLFGHVDLLKEAFDLKAEVTPAVGASLPALAALAGYSNPLTALAVYTVMKVLPGINENLITYHYEIKGPWLNPTIKGADDESDEVQRPDLSEDSILDLQ